MDALDLGLLVAMAAATATLSGVLGMAGGVVLLSVMLLYLEPLAAIPVHGAIQLVSNGARTVALRRHVVWSLTWRQALLLLPAGWLGLQVAYRVPAGALRAAIGIFVLVATWRPRWLLLGASPEQVRPGPRFVALGAAVGFLGPIIGATGPLLGPFFLNLGLTRQAIVGTQAVCQAAGHLGKILLFGVTGFDFGDHLALLLLMSGGVIAGTALGTSLLEHASERVFSLLYRGVLTAIALRLVGVEAWRWLAS